MVDTKYETTKRYIKTLAILGKTRVKVFMDYNDDPVICAENINIYIAFEFVGLDRGGKELLVGAVPPPTVDRWNINHITQWKSWFTSMTTMSYEDLRMHLLTRGKKT